MKSAEQRFLAKIKVDQQTGCWIWTGATVAGKYGKFWDGTRVVLSHRWSYKHWVGPVPPSDDIDHFQCERTLCVHPSHIRPATKRENTLRGKSFASRNAAKDFCVRGHQFDSDNTYVDSRNRRECRKCRVIRQRQIKQRRKAA